MFNHSERKLLCLSKESFFSYLASSSTWNCSRYSRGGYFPGIEAGDHAPKVLDIIQGARTMLAIKKDQLNEHASMLFTKR